MAAVNVEDTVAVHHVALLVHGQAAVSVAVKGKADIHLIVDHILLQALDVGGAAVCVDVHAVGGVIDHVGLSTQGLEDALGDHPGAAVGTVQGHTHILIGVGGQGDQVADVAITAGGIIDDLTDVLAGGVGQIMLAVQVLLDLVDDLLLHLLAMAIDELQAIILERVVAGGDHNAAVKLIHLSDVGHAGGGGHVHQVNVAAGSGDTGRQSALEHIAGTAGILADDDLGLVVTAIVPAQETAHLEGVVHGQIHIGFAAEAVSTKIFRHGLHSIYISQKNPLFGFCLILYYTTIP